jgi:phage-related protein
MSSVTEIFNSIFSIFDLIGYFFSVLSYLLSMGFYSITYLTGIIGYFIKGFYDQLSIVGRLFDSLVQIINYVFEYIGYVIGGIASIISFFVNLAETGGDDDLF